MGDEPVDRPSAEDRAGTNLQRQPASRLTVIADRGRAVESVWVSVAPGLEPALVSELAEIGWPQPQVEPGGASIRATRVQLGRLLAECRVASGIRVRLGGFQATSLDGLAQGVRALPWERYAWTRQPLDVHVAVRHCRLGIRERIAAKVVVAVADALRRPRLPGPRPPRDALVVHVRGEDDRFDVSVDAAGEPLHRRGWRAEGGRAPIRECLAAAALRLAGFRPGQALVDPMCGSGTFVLEAATWAAGGSAVERRSLAAERWPDPIAPTVAVRPHRAGPVLVGSDRDEAVVAIARRNAGRAGVARMTRFDVRDATTCTPTAPRGLLIANPPYGARLGTDVRGAFGILRALREGPFAAWTLAVIVPGPDRRLLGALGPGATVVAVFPHGGGRVALAVQSG